jgi:RNA polymerase sigma factor (TIGR02999 family)
MAHPKPLPEPSTTGEFRRLLARVNEGYAEDRSRLFALVYEDLRRIASHHLRGRPTGTLGTTAMVNETYLRLAGPSDSSWENRAHFLSVASRAMRHILVDHARRKLAAKRGGGAPAVELEEAHAADEPRILEILELDQALQKLGELSERLVRVVELRYFGDLSEEETARVLGVNDRTVRRDWRKARAFLHHCLRDGETA